MGSKQFWTIFNVLLILGTVIGILQPAYQTDLGLTQILLSLLHPQWSQEFLMRWLLVIVFVAASYSFAIGMIFKDLPITIIWTKINVNFAEPDGSKVELRREQLFRANRSDVTAYFSAHRPDSPNGRVPHDQIEVGMHCIGCSLQDSKEITGSDSGRTELIHMFGQALPYKWYMPLIPKWTINRDYGRLPKWIAKYLAVRRNKVVYVNEYNVPRPVLEFHTSSEKYQQFNMTIRLNFGQMKIPETLRVRRVKSNGVVNVEYDSQPMEDAVVVTLDRMHNEFLRITWSNSAPQIADGSGGNVPLPVPAEIP